MTHYHIGICPEFKPGDMPPAGYIQKIEWSEIQLKAGLKQNTCGMCGKWKFPQEMNPEIHLSTSWTKKNGGKRVIKQYQNCLKCQPIEGK